MAKSKFEAVQIDGLAFLNEDQMEVLGFTPSETKLYMSLREGGEIKKEADFLTFRTLSAKCEAADVDLSDYEDTKAGGTDIDAAAAQKRDWESGENADYSQIISPDDCEGQFVEGICMNEDFQSEKLRELPQGDTPQEQMPMQHFLEIQLTSPVKGKQNAYQIGQKVLIKKMGALEFKMKGIQDLEIIPGTTAIRLQIGSEKKIDGGKKVRQFPFFAIDRNTAKKV